MRPILIAVTALALPMSAQPGPGRCCGPGMRQGEAAAPIASNPVVEIQGVVGQIHISPGQGMPYVEVKRGNDSTKVYLGSMRYLIAENFSPKTGQQVVIKGYKTADSIIAIEVTLTAENKTLKLRDEKGWPVWAGGPGRWGRRPGPPR